MSQSASVFLSDFMARKLKAPEEAADFLLSILKNECEDDAEMYRRMIAQALIYIGRAYGVAIAEEIRT